MCQNVCPTRAKDQTDKKNSSPPNQWGEEESFSGNTVPGPPLGTRKGYFRLFNVLCVQSQHVSNIKAQYLFPSSGTRYNPTQIGRIIHILFTKVNETLFQFRVYYPVK